MIKETIAQLRKAGNEMLASANKLESLLHGSWILEKNESKTTAKKILKSIKRKNPWKNPKYRTRMLKHMKMMRAAKRKMGK